MTTTTHRLVRISKRSGACACGEQYKIEFGPIRDQHRTHTDSLKVGTVRDMTPKPRAGWHTIETRKVEMPHGTATVEILEDMAAKPHRLVQVGVEGKTLRAHVGYEDETKALCGKPSTGPFEGNLSPLAILRHSACCSGCWNKARKIGLLEIAPK